MRSTSRKFAVAASVVVVVGAIGSPGVSTARPAADQSAHARSSDMVDVSKLPICKVKPWKGFETPEEADSIPEDAPTCLTPQDRVKTLRAGNGVPSPIPIGGDGGNGPYRHNGVQSSHRYKGIQATIQVSNPSVTHDGSYNEMVVSRIMGKAYQTSKWLEAGWVEASWLADTPFVYTFTDQDGEWEYYSDYSLSRSLYYRFRVDRCYVLNTTTIRTCAEIFWNGEWHVLTWWLYGCSYYDGGTDSERCYGEAMTEIFSQDSTPWPSIATGNSIDWDAVQIRPNLTWYNLGGSYPASEGAQSPYVLCWQAHSYDFSVSKNSC